MVFDESPAEFGCAPKAGTLPASSFSPMRGGGIRARWRGPRHHEPLRRRGAN